MAQSGSTISGVSGRYALSLFELALEDNALKQVEADLAAFKEMLDGSEDLQRLMKSPVFSADQQTAAISAVLDKAGMKGLVANFIRVAASNRRLFAVPAMIRDFRQLAAEHRGEQAADVISAHKFTGAQEKELKAALKEIAGKEVPLNVTVDPSLLGGMIVKMGSRQIDTSLKTKLNSLKLALKEVG